MNRAEKQLSSAVSSSEYLSSPAEIVIHTNSVEIGREPVPAGFLTCIISSQRHSLLPRVQGQGELISSASRSFDAVGGAPLQLSVDTEGQREQLLSGFSWDRGDSTSRVIIRTSLLMQHEGPSQQVFNTLLFETDDEPSRDTRDMPKSMIGTATGVLADVGWPGIIVANPTLATRLRETGALTVGDDNVAILESEFSAARALPVWGLEPRPYRVILHNERTPIVVPGAYVRPALSARFEPERILDLYVQSDLSDPYPVELSSETVRGVLSATLRGFVSGEVGTLVITLHDSPSHRFDEVDAFSSVELFVPYAATSGFAGGKDPVYVVS